MAASLTLALLVLVFVAMGWGYWKGWQHALADAEKPSRLGRIMEAASDKAAGKRARPARVIDANGEAKE